MAITYTRNIISIVTKDIVVANTQLNSCITSVSWEYTGTNANNVSGTFYGTMSWDRNPDRYIDPNNFTSYGSVTEAQVLNWIDARSNDLYLEHQKEIVKKEIKRKSPQNDIASGDFPWQ